YRGRSFKPRRLGGRHATDAFQDGDVLVREANLPADGGQGVTHPYPVLRLDRRRQDLAHLGLRTAAVLRRPHPQGPVHVFRHASDRQDCHDKTPPFYTFPRLALSIPSTSPEPLAP